MNSDKITFIIVLLIFESGLTADLEVSNLLKMQKGIGWPPTLHVAVGHEALLKLSKTVENMQSCVVTTPQGVMFDVKNPPSNRYKPWDDDCGVRVMDINTSDEGRWRLTAIGSSQLTGWTEVYVAGAAEQDTVSQISLLDGEKNKEVELTSLNNSYCVVTQPFSDSSLVPGHCLVTLDRANRAVQGKWNILVGLPGHVSELQIEKNINVNAERLDVGFIRESTKNRLHIYCNILNTVKNITFCRFQRHGASVGYNVMDGLSDGTHSYYGDGFAARHCGMTIENPGSDDYTTWRCSVGLQQWVGDKIVQQAPMQALVSIPAYRRSTRLTVRNDEDSRVMLVQENMSFTINCGATVSLNYCWFQHPNGSQYSPVAHDDTEQEFWYSGESLEVGDCSITFSHVREEDAGQWKCHMGSSEQKGIEITDTIMVRVTGPLAADIKELGATIGGSTSLYCRTSNGNRPLKYCRFLSPSYVGINVDSTVTKESAILGRFYFTPGHNLDHGDCSLTIDPVEVEDVGEWTCAALVDDLKLESRDTVLIYIEESTRLSRASTIGMAVGFSILVIILITVLIYKRGLLKMISRENNTNEITSMQSFGRQSDSSSSTTRSQNIQVQYTSERPN